jgi:RHS repeat-associated protein
VTGSLNTARDLHTATLLNNGTVLIAGGMDSNYNALSGAEIYDPTAATVTGSLNTARVSHTMTLLNNGAPLVAAGWDTNGNSLGSLGERYTYGPGVDEPPAMYQGLTAAYFHADGLGSITSLTGGTGQLAASYVYDPFGKLTTSSGTVTNPFQYTGREFDGESGLYYYRARYYESVTGRFMSEDPIRFRGGVNFYEYVGNGAVTFVDPTGMKCKELPCDPKNLRLAPTTVQPGNHEIDYSLMTVDGKPAQGQWYVFEHQTQSGGGRIKYGPQDYVSPRKQDQTNGFADSLTFGLDTVQTFTVSADPIYDPKCQHKVIIRYGNGQDYASQHVWSQGWLSDPVLINNYPTLPVMPTPSGR